MITTNDFTSLEDVERKVDEELLINKYRGVKRNIVAGVLQGYSFRKAGQMYGLSHTEIYKIKRELKEEYKDLFETYKSRQLDRERRRAIELLYEKIGIAIKKLTLTEFISIYIYPYYPEAQYKEWKTTKFQDILFSIWESNTKSCVLAPRDHLKTFTALCYIIKKIAEREYPIEVNYYHLTTASAMEKYQLMRRLIENSPVLSKVTGLQEARRDTQRDLEFSDGTVVKAIGWDTGVVGKHPHMIVLDDIIDRKVIYSDERSKKAIDKFYMDIVPMIGREEEDKKVILVGTAQRKDDIYHSLPEDYEFKVFKAIENGKPLSPELYDLKALEKIKEDVTKKFGTRYWNKEYMNEPFEASEVIINPDWILYYTDEELAQAREGHSSAIYIGADLSVGKKLGEGDYTAIVVIEVINSNPKKIYVREVYRGRIGLSARVEKLKDFNQRWRPTRLGVESVAFQYDTITEARRKHLLSVTDVNVSRSKIERYNDVLEPVFSNGQVYIKRDMNEFRKELINIPTGEHDDMADALVIALKVAGLDNKPRVRVI